MKVTSLKKVVIMFIVIFALGMTGCTGMKREFVKNKFPEKTVIKKAKQYISTKYDETVEITKISPYEYCYSVFDGSEFMAWQGYVLDTKEGYHIVCHVDEEKKGYFMDDKQQDEILEAIQKVVEKGLPYESQVYWNKDLKMKEYIYDEKKENDRFLDIEKYCFRNRLDGNNLKQLLKEDVNNPQICILFKNNDELDERVFQKVMKVFPEDLLGVWCYELAEDFEIHGLEEMSVLSVVKEADNFRDYNYTDNRACFENGVYSAVPCDVTEGGETCLELIKGWGNEKLAEPPMDFQYAIGEKEAVEGYNSILTLDLETFAEGNLLGKELHIYKTSKHGTEYYPVSESDGECQYIDQGRKLVIDRPHEYVFICVEEER